MTVLTATGIAVDDRPIQLLREESGQQWQHRAVVGLYPVTGIEGDEWSVDEWGDIEGEDCNDSPWTWIVDMDGTRMGVVAGCVTATSDVEVPTVKGYREVALRLVAMVDAFDGWEAPCLP